MKHTKGPWTITNYSDTVCIQNIREMPMKNGTIKETVFEITQGIIPNTANLKLIAAAPEMLDALESVYCECSSLYPHANNCFMIKVESILKKAKGE